MRRLRLYGLLLIFLVFPVVVRTVYMEGDEGYSIEEVMALYSAGQFRYIHTQGTSFFVSPDGNYVHARDDSLYRLSDGKVVEDFEKLTIFDPTGAYAWELGEGIYRLSDGRKIIEAELVNGDEENRVVVSGAVQFSRDGRYAAITGQGIYQLSDGQQIIVSDARYMSISVDSAYVSTSNDEVFRLSDAHQILELKDGDQLLWGKFSPDSAYLWADAVYRLTDQVRLFDVASPHGVSFTRDGLYAVILENGVYRLSDSKRLYPLDKSLPEFSLPIFSADQKYMSIVSDGIYRVADGEKLFDFGGPSSALATVGIFSPDSKYIFIGSDGVYRLSDQQKLFDVDGDASGGVYFSPDSQYLAADRVYRVADGEVIFDRGKATFSSSSEYVAIDYDGLYRLENKQKLFGIDGSVSEILPDDSYVSVGSAFYNDTKSVYQIPTGHQYLGLRILDIQAGILLVGNTLIIVDPDQTGQRLPFIQIEDGATALYAAANYDQTVSEVIRGKQYLAILETQDDWYLVNYDGWLGWIPAGAGKKFYVPE